MSDKAFTGGFADPVLGSQSVFRALMEAMARPGTLQSIASDLSPPAPLNRGAGAVLLTLADADTPVWLDRAARDAPDVADWIGFHTGAPLTENRGEARFAVITDLSAPVVGSGFALGTQDYPDRSTTLILCVSGFSGEHSLSLKGPGVRDTHSLSPDRLPAHFTDDWAANGRLFPRGVDIVLAAPDAVAAMPRTVRIVTNEEA